MATTEASEIDAAYVRRLARVAGLELSEGRAAALVPVCRALAEADRRLRARSLTGHPGEGEPRGPGLGGG